MAFNADDDGGNWFDANAPTNRAPANTLPMDQTPNGAPPAITFAGDPNVPSATIDPRTGNPLPPKLTFASNPSVDAYALPGQVTAPGASGAPSYVNMSDPTQAAVWQAFSAKGVQPRDQSDFQYWVDHINSSGGMGDQGNAGYWTSRMAQGQGGVGDYQERPEAGSSTDGMAAGDLLKPFTEQFAYDKFSAPTNITEQNDPGYEARLAADQEALQRGAAAHGTLLTGQTIMDAGQRAQTFASNEYGNVYNRAAQDYNTNYNNAYNQYLGRESTFYANQNNPFAKLLATSTLDSQNANAANQVNLGYAGLNSNNLNQANQLGFNYASLYSNTLGQGANNYGNYLTQGANANAAGQVANGNIWGNTFNNAGNTALGLYYNSQTPKYVPQNGAF